MLRARLRPIPLMLVAVFTTLAVREFLKASDRDRQFQAWLVEEPANVVLDPRVTGSTAFPLHVSCACAHGYPVLARAHGTATSLGDVEAAVSAWKARLVARRPDGTPGVERPLAPCSAVDGSEFGGVCLDYVHSFETEPAEAFELIIDEPAPPAAPERIEIYVRNHLCGLERVPAVIARVLGSGAAFVALIAVPFVPRPSRAGGTVTAPTNSTSQS